MNDVNLYLIINTIKIFLIIRKGGYVNLGGCYVALVTPFEKDNEIDEEGLRSNVDYLINNGVAGVVPCGTTGESATMTWQEHKKVIDIVIDEVKGKVSVIAGAGSNSTKEAIEAAQHAKNINADAILCITPYYNKPTQNGLYHHFKEITTNVRIPMIVYNVPSRTGVNILPETLEKLCESKFIIGVKEASGDILQVSEIHRRCGDRLTILSGDDMLTLPILSCGGKGVISVVGNILPLKMASMISAFLEKNITEALKIHEELLPVSQAMFIETNPISVKTAMNYLGFKAGTLRLPLISMAENNKQRLYSVLKENNIKPI